jgi:hypothetical protein
MLQKVNLTNREQSQEKNASLTNLGQQTVIGWEPQIILGVPIFSK